MKYSLKDLRADFPNESACLEWLVNWLYPEGIRCYNCRKVTNHYRLAGRKVYSCSRCGHQVSPMAGTIFHKSSTPLTLWFEAIWIMSANKSGTSAKQIERQLGVSYPTAWRMMHKIREMMTEPDDVLLGGEEKEVEIDETFVHPDPYKRSTARKKLGWENYGRQGQIILGMVQRDGVAKVWHIKATSGKVILPIVAKNVAYGTVIHTDGWRLYRNVLRMGYEHRVIDHGKKQYWTEDAHTQNIENLWSHFKRGTKGVYRYVSPKYLQNYANEYAWRYSHRKDVNMFWSLMGRVDKINKNI